LLIFSCQFSYRFARIRSDSFTFFLSLSNMKNALLLAALGALAAAGTPAASAQSANMGATHTGGKAAMCIGCHGIPGYKVAFPHVYHVPMISGQNPKYIESALKSYKSGDRKHPTMAAIAASLSDKDIADLAVYYGGAAK
jgi:cytochrome c553